MIWALSCALVWGLAAGPRALAEEPQAEFDSDTRARLEAIREHISELLAETPSDQREAVRQELLRALETTDSRGIEAQQAPAEGAPAPEPSNDRPVASPPVEMASGSEAVAASETVAASEVAATEATPAETPEIAAATNGAEGGGASTTRPPSASADASSEPATASERVVAPPPEVAPPVAPPRRVRPPRCTTLLSFDENGDGKVNAQDRWWRHLYVWIDRNGDRQPQEREVESVYERGVREIDAGLDGFYRKKGSLGEVRYDDTIVFDLGGDGFGSGRRPDDGILAIDATALRRGTGPSLESASGSPVEGIQPFREGQHLVLDDGRRVELTCRRR